MSNFYLNSISDSQKHYIDDSWVFLRELAQNSRDAGAFEIRIDPGGNGSGTEVIIFSDNGKGMTYKEARKYLFRLYSSSKLKEKASVGMYGIGFWTVMKYQPDTIIIESYSDEEDKWAVSLDKELNHKRVECKLEKFGTRVTLIREKHFSEYETFCSELEKGVIKFCRFIGRKNGRKKNLPVVFMGKVISEELRYDEGVTLKYGGRNFEGIVGLGKVPEVTFYIGGILAWEGYTLDEVSLLENEKEENDYTKSGIAPVFLINGRNLKVNMSRKELIADNSLKSIIKSSEKSLKELVQMCSDHAYPRTKIKKMFSAVKNLYRSISSSYWKIILITLILIIPAEFYLLKKLFPVGGSVVSFPDVVSTALYKQYSATVDMLGKGVIADVRYSPKNDILLRMFTAPVYDRKKGFIRNVEEKYINLRKSNFKSEDDYKVSIFIKNGGDIFLPYPIGYIVNEESIKISSEESIRLRKSDSGEFVLNVQGLNKMLKYTCTLDERVDDSFLDSKYLKFPGYVRFSNDIEKVIHELFYLSIDSKIEKAVKLTNILVKYDSSEGTAEYFKNFKKSEEWIVKVLEIGAGDCDVINGVLCLILRKSGVRSRLVIGLVGEKGFVKPQIHSWVEYFDKKWKNIDATINSNDSDVKKVLNTPSTFILEDKSDRSENKIKILPMILKVLFLLLILSVFPLVLFFREKFIKEKEKRGKLNPKNKIKARRDIIEIGKSYLLDPKLWNYNFNIVEQEIITTVSGKNISMKRGLKLLKEGKLFFGRTGNPLVDALKNSNEFIVDSENIIQYPIIKLFYGLIDLNRINDLAIDLEFKSGSEKSTTMLKEINLILKKVSWKNLICFEALNFDDKLLWDIDFSRIDFRKFFKKTGYPSRFIVLNMDSPELIEIINLYEFNRDLALKRFFQLIMDKSFFFYNDREISRKKILRTILNHG